jgi:hypothetical protein
MARTDTERLDAVVTRGLRVARWAGGQPYTVAQGNRIIVSPVTYVPIADLDYRQAIDTALDVLDAEAK